MAQSGRLSQGLLGCVFWSDTDGGRDSRVGLVPAALKAASHDFSVFLTLRLYEADKPHGPHIE